jgi:hypothetical protein
MLDTIIGIESTWVVYDRSSVKTCNFSLVPSILIDPMMSSQTIAAWADSGKILVDTVDSCEVQTPMSGGSYTYVINMKTGLITGLRATSPSGSIATHSYLYGFENGIYFLRRVSFSLYDTTIESTGGYDFYNIKVNGTQYSSIADEHRHARSPFAIRYRDRALGALTTSGYPLRVTWYDLLGRNRYAANLSTMPPAGRIERLCPPSLCPSGRYFIRLESPGHTETFDADLAP